MDAYVVERELLLFKVKTPESKRSVISNGDKLDVAGIYEWVNFYLVSGIVANQSALYNKASRDVPDS